MSTCGYSFFDTPIGRCAIAWGEQGICAVQLPESSEERARARLRRRIDEAGAESAPPEYVQRAIDGVIAMMSGREPHIDDIALDMRGVPEFNRRVYAVARAIPLGQTLTYGEVAKRLGEPGAARAVGQALGHNPFAPIVPCHRVLAAGARSGGFSANGGVDTKLRMLQIEGAAINGPGLFDGPMA